MRRPRRNGRQPRQTGFMATIAGNSRWDMDRWLANCRNTVVAGRATAGHNAGMGETGGLPGHGGMADVARLGGKNVRTGLGLGVDRRVAAVVARRAVGGGHRSGSARVAHGGGREGRVILVAGITLGRGPDVSGRLAKRVGAVVAG